MLTRHPTRRLRMLVAAVALAISAAISASGTAVAHHNKSFGMTGCVTPTGEFLLTATWNDMRITHWSYFIESTDGSGGTFQPVPVPGRSGTVTQSFEGPAPFDTVDAVSVSLFRGGGALREEMATGRLTRRPAGWPPCAAHPNTFGVTVCVTPTGEIVLTAAWTRMRITHWSYFIESTEGSGGTFQPVPVPGSSGTVTQSFEGDPTAVTSVTVSLFRGSGPGNQQLAKARLAQPPAGWPAC
jgi:hypothetical protein